MPHIQCCAEPGQGIQSYQTNTMDSLEAELLLSPTVTYCLISGGSLTIPGQNSQHVNIPDGQCNDITSGGSCEKRGFGFFSLFFPITISWLVPFYQKPPIIPGLMHWSLLASPFSFEHFHFQKYSTTYFTPCRWNNAYQCLIQSLVFEKLSISSFLMCKNQDARECWQMIELHCRHFSDHFYVSSAISV